MKSFDLLHPAIQHHIVNSVGWHTLRPLQEGSIAPLLGGKHAILLAPTAGGKTEAAFFPLLSRMLSERWSGLSVLYICPIKALLNNLESRLTRYSQLVGRRCGLWHGDIKAAPRNRILADPPDCLLTTPESIEVMLISRRVDRWHLFRNLRAVIVDELHAFAGDDRGWHLLSLLERLTKLAGRDLQRVGLSATVGNPEGLLGWLSGSTGGQGQVIAPQPNLAKDPDVQLDYVGSLNNAAIVISRLHRGEKRLVFCDSRARVEELASYLGGMGVDTYVSHSSLSIAERQRAEAAFNTGIDCVIVATSTLELGIDVGDLDRVIQIDAPNTVSSFLQRMGRTGRRIGAQRNCLFLATSRRALMCAAGLIELWSEGFIEPISPPAQPFHIFAQQIMALALQEVGIGFHRWREWIGRMLAFAEMSQEQADLILNYMIEKEILWDDQGLLWLGREGERNFGRKNFMELFSVFNSPPTFTVRYGQAEIGEVHEISFLLSTGDKPVLLLGGRSWLVIHLDWINRIAYVQPTDMQGKSRWLGSGQALSFEICQAIRRVLYARQESGHWSQRARTEIVGIREEFNWVMDGKTTVIVSPTNQCIIWWTFGGMRANSELAERLRVVTDLQVTCDNLAIKIEPLVNYDIFKNALEQIRETPVNTGSNPQLEAAIEGLKFSDCLPSDMAIAMLRARLDDGVGVDSLLSSGIRNLILHHASKGIRS